MGALGLDPFDPQILSDTLGVRQQIDDILDRDAGRLRRELRQS
jgi:hypothetical protein